MGADRPPLRISDSRASQLLRLQNLCGSSLMRCFLPRKAGREARMANGIPRQLCLARILKRLKLGARTDLPCGCSPRPMYRRFPPKFPSPVRPGLNCKRIKSLQGLNNEILYLPSFPDVSQTPQTADIIDLKLNTQDFTYNYLKLSMWAKSRNVPGAITMIAHLCLVTVTVAVS